MLMRYKLMIAREQSEYSKEQVARALGVTVRHYNSLEAGTTDGSIKIWKRLSNLLNKPIDYLLQQTDEHSA